MLSGGSTAFLLGEFADDGDASVLEGATDANRLRCAETPTGTKRWISGVRELGA